MTNELMKELEKLRAYKDETVWRLTEEDIRCVLEEMISDESELEEEDADNIVQSAKRKLEIEWTEYVEAFIHVSFSEVLGKYQQEEESI